MPSQFLPLVVAGGSGFVLSFLIGLISGVPFLDLLIRALLSGGVLAGLTFGLMTLLKAQFPELFELNGPSESDQGLGQNVNITMDSQGDESEEIYAPSNSESEVVTGEDRFVEEYDEDQAIETGDEERPSSPPQTMEQPVTRQGNSEVHEEEVSEVEGVDEMPELGAFADSFRMQEPAGTRVDEMGPSGSKNRHSEGFEDDPALVARAVQTVLKRSP